MTDLASATFGSRIEFATDGTRAVQTYFTVHHNMTTLTISYRWQIGHPT